MQSAFIVNSLYRKNRGKSAFIGPAGPDHLSTVAQLMSRIRQKSVEMLALRAGQRVLDPERAFDELVRVTKPGGQLVVIDTDWATLTIDSDENDIERHLVRFHTKHMMNIPYSGHHLHRMFTNRGMMGCHIDVQPVFVTDVALARQRQAGSLPARLR